jgi:hypothetical protein
VTRSGGTGLYVCGVVHPSDVRLLVLHGLRLKGFGAPDEVAAIVDVDTDLLVKHLEDLERDSLVIHREGRLSGWALTPAGRAEQERLLAEEVAAFGVGAAVERAYHDFLRLNPELLAACTAWQVRGGNINDHRDVTYDHEIIDRLGRLHARLEPVLDHLEMSLDRFAGYRIRLDAALARLEAGDSDWFTRPVIDSYHTVWFQLHEDLLTTLGIERSEESRDDNGGGGRSGRS